MTRRGKIGLGVGVAALFAFVAIIVVCASLFSFFSEPIFVDQEHQADSELIQKFYQNRERFEEMRSMLERDSHIFRIDDNWSDPANLSDEILIKYRSMFEQLGVPRGFYNRRNPLRIELIASSQGWVSSGSMKGYEYRETKPESLEKNLDKFHDGTITHWTESHRRIDGNWYLFFRR